MADGRDAADGEAGQLVRLARGGAADVAIAADGGQTGEIDPVGPGHERQDRLRSGIGRRDEHERFDDLPQLRPDRRGGLLGGVGRLVEDRDRQRDALAGGGVDDTPNGGVVGGVRHGAESSIGA